MPSTRSIPRVLATWVAAVVIPSLALAQASYTAYRQSCPGSAGTPHLSAGAPIIGGVWTLTIADLLPSSTGFVCFALRDDIFWPNVLPLDLAPIGAPGCFLNVNSDPALGAVVLMLPADAAGRAVLTASVPSDPAVIGVTYFNQYVSLDAPPGRVLPITLTNAGRGVVGRLGVPNMVPIGPGTYLRGSTFGGLYELPVHTVHITRPFWIGKYEVTQAEWLAVLGTQPFNYSGPNRPVESVSWDEAMAYCAALNAREQAAGRLPAGYEYRLPTEGEWEYCCRAGTTTEWNVGSTLTCMDANVAESFVVRCVGRTTDVGSYAANAWGLYDMHGNVREWCLDSWNAIDPHYPAHAVSDPYSRSGSRRVTRGGNWFHSLTSSRSADRDFSYPYQQTFFFGFRIVLAPVIVP